MRLVKRVFFPLITSIVLLVFATSVFAEPKNLSGTQVRKIIAGKTLVLATPYGFELPIRYRGNGTMTGHSRKFARLNSANGKTKDRGRWWIQGDRLCQKWKDWLNGKSYCFRIKQQGRKVYWTSHNGFKGTARIEG